MFLTFTNEKRLINVLYGVLPVDRLYVIMPETPAIPLHSKLLALNNGRGREGISHHSQFPINTSGWLPVKLVQRAWIQRCYWFQALCPEVQGIGT